MTNATDKMNLTNENVLDLVVKTYGVRTPLDQLTDAQTNTLSHMVCQTIEVLYLVSEEISDGEWRVDAKLAKRLARRTVMAYLAGAEDARHAMADAINAATCIF